MIEIICNALLLATAIFALLLTLSVGAKVVREHDISVRLLFVWAVNVIAFLALKGWL